MPGELPLYHFFTTRDIACLYGFHNRMQASGSPPIGLEDFVKQDDVVLHGASTCSSSKTKADSHESPQLQLPSGPLPLPHTSPTPPTTPQLSRVLAKGLNLSDEEASDEYMPLVDAVPLVHLSIRPAAFATIEDLHVHLDKLDLVSEHRVRPRYAASWVYLELFLNSWCCQLGQLLYDPSRTGLLAVRCIIFFC